MKEIVLSNKERIFFYKKYSLKAKNISISIQNWELILTIPKASIFQSQENLDKKALEFLKSKKNWILKHIKNSKISLNWQWKNPNLYNYSKEHYLKYKEQARNLCEQKAKFWAEKMEVKYNRIAIKSLKTKWGSCSSKKNLNFNYKILFLDEEKQNYLIVHELAHLIHMNHSEKFWDLVCKTLWDKKYKRFKIL